MLSVGGIRHQFSMKENIELSMFTSDFLRNIKENLSVLGNVFLLLFLHVCLLLLFLLLLLLLCLLFRLLPLQHTDITIMVDWEICCLSSSLSSSFLKG